MTRKGQNANEHLGRRPIPPKVLATPRVRLKPTLAIERGTSTLWQCVRCGSMVCAVTTQLRHGGRPQGPCPCCESKTTWTQQVFPTGAFTYADAPPPRPVQVV